MVTVGLFKLVIWILTKYLPQDKVSIVLHMYENQISTFLRPKIDDRNHNMNNNKPKHNTTHWLFQIMKIIKGLCQNQTDFLPIRKFEKIISLLRKNLWILYLWSRLLIYSASKVTNISVLKIAFTLVTIITSKCIMMLTETSNRFETILKLTIKIFLWKKYIKFWQKTWDFWILGKTMAKK